ncbi:hypothetical protein BWR15_30865, partial [Pseudomonas sp. T]
IEFLLSGSIKLFSYHVLRYATCSIVNFHGYLMCIRSKAYAFNRRIFRHWREECNTAGYLILSAFLIQPKDSSGFR